MIVGKQLTPEDIADMLYSPDLGQREFVVRSVNEFSGLLKFVETFRDEYATEGSYDNVIDWVDALYGWSTALIGEPENETK